MGRPRRWSECPCIGEELFTWFVDTLTNVKGRLPSCLLPSCLLPGPAAQPVVTAMVCGMPRTVLYERLVFVRRFILHGPGGAKAASSQDAPAKRRSGRVNIRKSARRG